MNRQNKKTNNLDSTPDHSLMVQVKNGNLDKLGVLFERYHRRLFGFFYRITYQRELSEDLVQGVFERILKYRSTYADEGEFGTWVFRIARNHYADHYRKIKARPVESMETDWSRFSGTGETSGAAFHTDFEAEMNRMLVRQALEQLDPEKRQVLVLSRFEGFRYREIAGIMDCSEGAVKVRVFRALNELKEIITDLRKIP